MLDIIIKEKPKNGVKTPRDICGGLIVAATGTNCKFIKRTS
jgi:hypothetical protein